MSDFQVMPELTTAEYAKLKAEIAAHGVLVPIEYDQNGAVIDGHNRLRACEELGIKDYPTVMRQYRDDDERRRNARLLNLSRRHLSREQKRQLIADEIKADPDRSDRQIGRLIGVDHKTVGAVRRELTGEIPHHRLAHVLRDEDYGPYDVHPYITHFPLMPVEEFALLCESIRRLGLLSPITLTHDRRTIVDGRLRYLACQAVHVDPAFRTLDEGADDGEIGSYVISLNVMRGHWEPGQRAALEAELQALREQERGGGR